MKTFVKILTAIVVIAAICGGVYLVLPETAQIFVKGYIQYKVNDDAKTRIDRLKDDNTIVYSQTQTNGTVKKVDTGVKYGDALTNCAKTTVWYYEEVGAGFKITYYGTKVSMDLSKYGSDGTYIDKTLKIVFDFTNDKSTITVYIGDEMCDETMQSAVLQAVAAGN